MENASSESILSYDISLMLYSPIVNTSETLKFHIINMLSQIIFPLIQ